MKSNIISRPFAMLTAALLLGLAGCKTPQAKTAGPSPAPAATKPAAASMPADTGKSGNQLWADNCARCHNTRSPLAYSDAEWTVAMHHMRIRANLTAEEHTQILDFLQSAN